MELSALIHCRTYQFDFNSEFLARPKDFSSDDVRWARKHILTATSYCDELVGQRNLVFNNSKFMVFGVVCLLNEALKKYNFSEEEIECFSFDENGRKIKCFLGFVSHMENKKCGTAPKLSNEDYAGLLKSYVANKKIFFGNKQPQIEVEYSIKVETKTISLNPPQPYDISSLDRDEEYYQFALSKVGKKGSDVNACTNVYNIKMLSEGKYNLFTTNLNTIQRYKQKKEEKKENKKKSEENSEIVNPKKKGKKMVVFVTSALILAVVGILAILLLKKM